MAYKKCEFKDGETVITAETLNKMQDAICGMEQIVEKHPQDKNNPHGVTAEQVGAHPNTWMPTAEQVGARPNTWMPSAQDVDATPASHAEDKTNPHGVTAEQVGARPDTWLPTIGEIGAAPAGYVAETGQYTNYADALARIKSVFASMSNGEKRYLFMDVLNGSAWDGEFPSGSYFVEIYREWPEYGTVIFTSNAYIKIVVRIAGSWGDFCYENPPMLLGVEYRTTERYNGKPVYAKLVNIGALPNATSRYVDNPPPLPVGIYAISISGVGVSGYSSVPIQSSGIYVSVQSDWGGMYVSTTSDYSEFTGYVIVKYTKISWEG